MSEITLNIDGKDVKAQAGDTVLDAARRADISIPTLCAHDDLQAHGTCRHCEVKIDGTNGFPTACTTPAVDGMVVKTKTDDVEELRKNILKLLLSGHTSPCLVCADRELCEKYRPRPSKSGRATRCETCSSRDDCELRKLAEEYEIEDIGLPVMYKDIDAERDDPFMDRDYSLCVLCGRCVRICAKLHDEPSIDFIERGDDARIGTAFYRDHSESNCRFCGACVDICPNGAMTDRFAKWAGAPDRTQESVCRLCPARCRLNLKTSKGKLVATAAVSFSREDRICAVGRFVYPRILDAPARIRSHRIVIEDGPSKAGYGEAVEKAAEGLSAFTGNEFQMIAPASASPGELNVLRKFTNEVMKSENFEVAPRDGSKVALASGVKAVFLTGDFIEKINDTNFSVVSDILPSGASEAADVLFAAAVLDEGTLVSAPEECSPDWRTVRDIARKMGAGGFDFESPDDVEGPLEEAPREIPDPSPIDDVRALPRWYRGHEMRIVCPGLITLAGEAKKETGEETGEGEDRPFEIVEKSEIVPNMHMLSIRAPEVAAKCEPGNFVIGIANERSERIPYTVADWDVEQGVVTVNVIEAGRSTREVALMNRGDHFSHFTGPLGLSLEVRKYGTVLCAGGCFGVGAMLPIARAMKQAGNKVICIEEASSSYLLYWRDKLEAECDRLIVATKDGTEGVRGGISQAIDLLAGEGEKIDQAFVCGCTFMMMQVSEKTRQLEIPVLTALSPIMLDGTGMCGACRVTVEGETRFACVDGPFFDGHQIDWVELMQRRATFLQEEIEALREEPGGGHRCIEA